MSGSKRATVFVIILVSIIHVACACATTVFPLAELFEADEEGLLQLVNTDNLFDEETRRKDLVQLTVRMSSEDAGLRLRRAASRALTELFAAADAEGVRLYAISAYRDFATQKALYYNNIKDVGYDDKSTQLPGASEHQTGLAADVVSRDWLGYTLTEAFEQTPEAQWLAVRCADFGFIIRYPKGKEAVTGIVYEPWHIRYVGQQAARYMADNQLTLEELWLEYYVYLEDHGF